MDFAEFLSLYDIRSPNIMWFLGAGASAAGGVPTAYDMIWDFKSRIYCTEQRIPISSIENLSDPNLRAKIQRYFDSRGGYPSVDTDDEYAYYFEALYQDAADRQRYIDQMVSSGHPSYGHKALAALLKLDKARIVWTTNFDRLIEDAVAEIYGSTGKLVTATLSEPDIALQAMNDNRWPLLVKLHGDFQSRRLKNILDELKNQDRKMRDALIDACCRYGLAVVGYSGRDISVMEALTTAVESGKGFPNGLFWFNRSYGITSPVVRELVDKARTKGITAEIIPIETFDEFIPDTLALIQNIPLDIREILDQRHERFSKPPLQPIGGQFPYIRLNTLYVRSVPGVCRLVECDIDGTKAVRKAVEESGTQVIAVRKNVGVLAFGRDIDIRKTFEPYGIKTFDIYQIQEHRILHDSAEHGLLHDALCAALCRERPVQVHRSRHTNTLIADTEQLNDPLYQYLKDAISRVKGKDNHRIAGEINGISWSEALKLKLEYRLGRVWLIISPTLWVNWPEGTDPESDLVEQDGTASQIEEIKEFVRERLATRYNRVWHDIMVAWIKLITNNQTECELQAMNIADGIDAKFTINKGSGFSRRAYKKK